MTGMRRAACQGRAGGGPFVEQCHRRFQQRTLRGKQDMVSRKAFWQRKRYAEDPEYRKNRLRTNEEWRVANRDKVEASRQKRRYGLSTKDRKALLARQGGVCGICKRKGRKLHVDHCHETDKVRGLLCGKCNRGLGHYDDEPDLMRAAADYLEGARRAAMATGSSGVTDAGHPARFLDFDHRRLGSEPTYLPRSSRRCWTTRSLGTRALRSTCVIARAGFAPAVLWRIRVALGLLHRSYCVLRPGQPLGEAPAHGGRYGFSRRKSHEPITSKKNDTAIDCRPDLVHPIFETTRAVGKWHGTGYSRSLHAGGCLDHVRRICRTVFGVPAGGSRQDDEVRYFTDPKSLSAQLHGGRCVAASAASRTFSISVR